MHSGAGFHGELTNVNVSGEPGIDHFTIDKSPQLQALVMKSVLQAASAQSCRPGVDAPVPHAAAPLRRRGLRAWRIDRKRPFFRPGAASLGVAHFTVRKPILGETACVPQRGRLRRRTKAFGESSKSQLPLSQDQGLFRTPWLSTTIQPRRTSRCFSARLRGHARIRQGRWALACSMKVGLSAVYLGSSW